MQPRDARALAAVVDVASGIVIAWSELAPSATEEIVRVAKLTCADGS